MAGNKEDAKLGTQKQDTCSLDDSVVGKGSKLTMNAKKSKQCQPLCDALLPL